VAEDGRSVMDPWPNLANALDGHAGAYNSGPVMQRTSTTTSMSVGEFETIQRYFRRSLPERDDVLLGIGDDAALVQVPDGHVLVTALATLSTADWDESCGDGTRLGRRVMAVTMNRLAAAGARPAWATLALTLPDTDAPWLAAFSDALFAVAAPLSVALIGGDTTRGPFTVTVVAHGLLDAIGTQSRTMVRAGDSVCLSGGPGNPSLDDALADGQARIALGQWIRRHAGVAADTSDGLGAALVDLLASDRGLGAHIDLSRLPETSTPCQPGDELSRRGNLQLCFTLPGKSDAAMESAGGDTHPGWTRLGTVTDSGLLACAHHDGQILTLPVRAHQDAVP
jgi:thiamine-monophosphate kinase